MKIRTAFSWVMAGLSNWSGTIAERRWTQDPFGHKPHASRETYTQLFAQARAQEFPEIDRLEKEIGICIDREWLDDLALHTQIVIKRSSLAYPHGRLIYALLRHRIVTSGLRFVSVIETGTARGFSAVCMSKSIADSGAEGRVITMDVLGHRTRHLWNCIDDHSGPTSRAELLAPWTSLLERVVFLRGASQHMLPRVGVDRVHFAYLDAQHTYGAVMAEFRVVAALQCAGDVVVFDDVTPGVFPGVVRAVAEIERSGLYKIHRLTASRERSYAWGVRL